MYKGDSISGCLIPTMWVTESFLCGIVAPALSKPFIHAVAKASRRTEVSQNLLSFPTPPNQGFILLSPAPTSPNPSFQYNFLV